MKRTVIILMLILVCISVSLNAKTKAEKRLETNLNQWQKFRWEGILQVQSSAFSMRKNFVLAKTGDALRFDILDSGVMGLSAQPLVSIYLKDTAILNAPTIEQLAGLDLNWFLPPGAVKGMVGFADSLLMKQKEILADRKATTAGTSFAFDKQYRLSSFSSPATRMEASIIYNTRNLPTKIQIRFSGSQVAELLINEREYKDVSIEPLEAVSDSLDLMQLLEGIDLEGYEFELE